ncbi:MAG: SGNH/GDSL hydrolase family protein [Clostridia bacterium]|nr:SGNH/GDSL hydrolase family protein [Clostridia bacterium]
MNYFEKKATKEILCDGECIAISSPNSKNYNKIEFNAKVTSFDNNSKVVISHGKTSPWCSAYIVIDAESVYLYEYLREEKLLEKIPHGLSISGSVNILITVGAGFFANLVITAPSGSFTKEIFWNGSREDILAESTGATFTDCTLTYRIDGINKDIWLIGDSYFDFWGKYIVNLGYGNFYLDGHSGRCTDVAIDSIKTNLLYAKPKKMVWFMGMNDPDEEDKVNSSWINCFYILRDICLENDIELILSTVPNTPERNNKYKNEIVRNSGYRYIEICSAVGADTCRGWTSGLIDPEDYVHPSPEGTKIISECILSALPEIE